MHIHRSFAYTFWGFTGFLIIRLLTNRIECFERPWAACHCSCPFASWRGTCQVCDGGGYYLAPLVPGVSLYIQFRHQAFGVSWCAWSVDGGGKASMGRSWGFPWTGWSSVVSLDRKLELEDGTQEGGSSSFWAWILGCLQVTLDYCLS